MEEILMIICQAIFEIVAYLPWDLFLYGDVSDSDRPIALGFLGMFLGAMVGYVSLLFWPDVIAKWSWLRLTLFFISPLISGLAGYGLAILRRRKREDVVPWRHFGWSWAFTFGLVAVRFAFAVRPGHPAA